MVAIAGLYQAIEEPPHAPDLTRGSRAAHRIAIQHKHDQDLGRCGPVLIDPDGHRGVGRCWRAIAYADRMVARSQDSAFISDRSAFARGTLGEGTRQSDFVRMFTTPQGNMITKLNRGSTTVRKGLRGMYSTNSAQMVASASNMAVA